MVVFTNQKALEEKEPAAGFKARFIHLTAHANRRVIIARMLKI